jgi:NAD-dependent protein deacetylase/lipoamidase
MTLTDHIREAHRILIFTGAGISTGSGIPDFRGPQGVWTRRQPVYYQDFMSSEAARREYWDQKLESWDTFRTARPNVVHYAAHTLELAGKLLMLVTQNVDGLHARAGTSAERLLELHGTNAEVECQSCLRRAPADPTVQRFKVERVPPRCECGGLLKTATISFGQSLDPDVLERAQEAAQECDLVIALGSTLSVQPACLVPLLAAQRGAPYIVVNRGPTDHDDEPFVALRLDGDVAEIFPPAVQAAVGPMHR